MVSKKITVADLTDQHKNPVAELVQAACRYDSEIILESGSRRINAKSIMGILAFNPGPGMEVTVETKGSDEETAFAAMEKFLCCK